ncbi:MAG: hypothetical protein A2Z08_07415 [Deltaproteobacteria bacterium RBG_16_54_11]|nr:MAG: hypothetical protein A2Z08_07415 [Deltaproteobacteria bacterium RBG_16_54_11]
MSQCIFCKSTSGPFSTQEHILPESLIGENDAILPDGLYCDKCQNVFGSSVEQQAIGNYPFNQLRVLFQIPTKKRKKPWFKSGEGIFIATDRPKIIEYIPSPPFVEAMKEGRKTVIRVLAEPKRPDMVCRFLLKMALENVALNNREMVFKEKYDCARNYALYGEKNQEWWYLQKENLTALNVAIKTRTHPDSWNDPIICKIYVFIDGAEIFFFKLYYLELFTPLLANTPPPLLDPLTMKEPEYRLFKV